jgi:predicted phage-related endonuclease
MSASIADSHRTAIGCSKIGQALGVGRFGTRYELWMMHTGRAEPEDLSSELRVALGEPMEDVLRPFVAQRLDRDLRRDRKVYRHETLPLIAHVDYRTSKRPGEKLRPVLDMKTSLGFGARHRFGDDGSDEVDDDVMLQMQGYLMLTGAELAYVAALVPGPELKIYTIKADRELHEMICDGIADYWRLVESDTPPDPQDEYEARQRWSTHQPGKISEVDDRTADLLRQYAGLTSTLKALEDRKKILRDQIIPYLEDADTIEHGGIPYATYRANKDSKEVDYRELADHLLQTMEIDNDERESLIKAYTKTKPGARVLRLKKELTTQTQGEAA